MEVLLLIIMCLSNTLCFTIGARVGQKVVKGEPIVIPNPVEAIKKKEQKIEMSKYEKILANVDNYNGTDQGQQEVR